MTRIATLNLESDTADLAAIIIDMQRFFLDSINLPPLNTLLANQTKAIRWCVSQNIPIVYVEYLASQENHYTGAMTYGSTHNVLQIEIDKAKEKVRIYKKLDDAFNNESLDLEALLKKTWNRHRSLIMGVNADGCIMQTASNAKSRNITPITARGLLGITRSHWLKLTAKSRLEDGENYFNENGILFNSTDEMIDHFTQPKASAPYLEKPNALKRFYSAFS